MSIPKPPKGFDFIEPPPAGFDFLDPPEEVSSTNERPYSPFSIKGAAKAYGAGAAGGAGGLLPDVLTALDPVKKLSPTLQSLSKLNQAAGFKTTPELTESINPEGPQNAAERILQQSGEFGGQEGLIGTALGGPIGGGLGLAHGSVTGALYGGLKELGVPDLWALGISAFATVSPVAAERLIQSYKEGKEIKKALASITKEFPELKEFNVGKRSLGEGEFSGGEPPGGGSQPFSKKEALKDFEEMLTRNEVPYDTATKALENLQEPTVISPKNNLPQPKDKIESGKPLAGRVKEISKEPVVESEKTSQISLPIEEGKSLKGRVKKTYNEVENSITPDSFKSDAQAGRALENETKKLAYDSKKKVSKLYEDAEGSFKGKEAAFENLAKQNDELISRLEETAQRNPGEEAVYQAAINLRKKIGQSNNLIGAKYTDLIRTADSISGRANYEMPYIGPKGVLKKMVKNINEAVIDVGKHNGIPVEKMQKADKAYSEWAQMFLNDEISPFLERTIRDPENLFSKSIKDNGVYRALREVLSSKKRGKTLSKIDREIAASRMKKYIENPDNISSPSYNKDLKNLKELIGDKNANKVDKILKERAKTPRPAPQREITKKPPSQISPQRITSSTQQKLKYPSTIEKIEGPPKQREITKKPPSQISPERITSATVKKASKYLNRTPEDIIKMTNSLSGIRQLEKDLLAKGKWDVFDELMVNKTKDIFREGKVEPGKMTGERLYNILNKTENYDILSQIYGKENLNRMLEVSKKLAKEELTQSKIMTSIKLAGKVGLSFVGLNKFIKILSPFMK